MSEKAGWGSQSDNEVAWGLVVFELHGGAQNALMETEAAVMGSVAF